LPVKSSSAAQAHVTHGLRPGPEDECTLFGACGYYAKGGGSLVLKNRDRNTRFIQSLVYETPRKGYSFLGIRNILPFEERTYSYTMGINEKGLICVNSSAPGKIKFPDGGRGDRHVLQAGRILKECASVDDFVSTYIAGRKLFGSMNYIVADQKKICVLELVDGGHYDYSIFINGTAAHSNHYLFDKLKSMQYYPIAPSTAKRLSRAQSLLKSGWPFTPDDFISFSRDHGISGRPDNDTICRHPDGIYDPKKFSGGTISAMVLRSVAGENPTAWVALGQPCTTRFVKFEITGGGPKMDALARELYTDGSINRAWEIERDVSVHFILPFLKNNKK